MKKVSGTAKPRGSDSNATRELLVTTALRLFAEQGVVGVSLRAVGDAANQRNTAAVHYHFGNRETLLAAALDRVLAAVREPVGFDDARRLGIAIGKPASPLHDAVGRAFLGILTLPLRYPEWGEDGARLLARVLLGEAASMAVELETKTMGDTADMIAELSPLLPGIPASLLRARLEFATVNVVCGLTASAYLAALAKAKFKSFRPQDLVGPLIDYISAGLAAPRA